MTYQRSILFAIAVFLFSLVAPGRICLGDNSDADVPGMIAFIRDGNVWIADANGDQPRQLTSTGDCHSLAWSPEGARIAYLKGGEVQSNMWLVSTTGGGGVAHSCSSELFLLLLDTW